MAPAPLIIGLLLLLIVAGILIYWVTNPFKSAITNTFDSTACSLSVQKAATLAKIPGQGIKSMKELPGCQTKEITTDETDPEKIHELLANNLESCWNMYIPSIQR